MEKILVTGVGSALLNSPSIFLKKIVSTPLLSNVEWAQILICENKIIQKDIVLTLEFIISYHQTKARGGVLNITQMNSIDSSQT